MHNYTATTQNAKQYKYNGKELQETGMYDYGARSTCRLLEDGAL